MRWFISIRYFVTHRRQSLVCIAGVTISVMMFITMTSLMNGLTDKFIEETVESSGHITIKDEPRETQTPILEARYRDPGALLMLVLLATVGGVLVRDHALSREVMRREQRMIAEFPTVAELLALSVAAGEGAVGALERLTRLSQGELARELGRALADARAGASLVRALEGIAERTSLPALARFVDGVAVAVERGTPLADVLRAQAADVREAGKRALLEAGGRKEIAMMVPVVFLVLPITVVFALFPGFYGLTFTTP